MQLINEEVLRVSASANEADTDSQKNQLLLHSKDILSGANLWQSHDVATCFVLAILQQKFLKMSIAGRTVGLQTENSSCECWTDKGQRRKCLGHLGWYWHLHVCCSLRELYFPMGLKWSIVVVVSLKPGQACI